MELLVSLAASLDHVQAFSFLSHSLACISRSKLFNYLSSFSVCFGWYKLFINTIMVRYCIHTALII